VDSQAQRLLALFERMTPADRTTLRRFAEFLVQQSDAAVPESGVEKAPVEIPEPADIARPAQEKVVEAVKRLSKTYFMLDRKSMLGATSDLVTQHILQGRDAVEVIDELERVFLESYQRFRQGGD
jgi:hypothetical protein